jgi:serine/threonine-protein kinase TTK/MPS1
MTEEEQSPLEEQADALDAAGASQPAESQESQEQQSQEHDKGSSQEAEKSWGSIHAPAYRDYAAHGSPVRPKDLIDSILRSKSPSPPVLSYSQQSKSSRPLSQAIPAFKLPAPRVDLPSAHDQENEAPPTFKRNKQPQLLQLGKIEKPVPRPQGVDMDAIMKTASPERRPLAPRSRNTPLRPAPPPPKMSILDAATSNAGAAAASTAGQKRNRLKVNGKVFTKLDTIGSGGSSRVYRVMAENSKFFALKRVSLADLDESIVSGFKGEIDLLQKLSHIERVIHLYDYEMNDEKNTLSVVSSPLLFSCFTY